MTTTITIYGLVAVAFAAAAILIKRDVQARLYRRKMLSYCARSADGTIYIRDPKTGVERNFSEYVAKRVAGDDPRTPRQKRRARRAVKRSIAGAIRNR